MDELLKMIDGLEAAIHRTNDVIFEHGKYGLPAMDNLLRKCKDIKSKAEELNKP